MIGDTIAYRGYLIKHGIDRSFSISKDGHHICWASTILKAKAEIDGLVGHPMSEHPKEAL